MTHVIRIKYRNNFFLEVYLPSALSGRASEGEWDSVFWYIQFLLVTYVAEMLECH